MLFFQPLLLLLFTFWSYTSACCVFCPLQAGYVRVRFVIYWQWVTMKPRPQLMDFFSFQRVNIWIREAALRAAQHRFYPTRVTRIKYKTAEPYSRVSVFFCILLTQIKCLFCHALSSKTTHVEMNCMMLVFTDFIQSEFASVVDLAPHSGCLFVLVLFCLSPGILRVEICLSMKMRN